MHACRVVGDGNWAGSHKKKVVERGSRERLHKVVSSFRKQSEVLARARSSPFCLVSPSISFLTPKLPRTKSNVESHNFDRKREREKNRNDGGLKDDFLELEISLGEVRI